MSYATTLLQMRFPRLRLASLVAASIAALCAAPSPGAADDFYRGKAIRIIVGSGAGGGFDLYARMLARRLPDHVPGTPTIIVQNMPGAGGAKATAYVATIAARDGTVIGAVTPGAIINPLLDERIRAEYDPRQLIFVGSMNNGTMVCVSTEQSGIRKFGDTFDKKTILGTAGEGDTTRDYALLHRQTTAAKFDIVGGYTNTPAILLAMERGEADGLCGWDWSSLKAQKIEEVRSRKLHVLVQVGLSPNPELVSMGVPEIWSFLKDAADADATRLVAAQQAFFRPYVMPPDTPAAAIADIRSAFAKTLQDPKFLEDARIAKLDINPVTGPEIQDSVKAIYSATPATLNRLRSILKP
jgi:tripartite-type tricarboxylate transporter receptor subunit TctC